MYNATISFAFDTNIWFCVCVCFFQSASTKFVHLEVERHCGSKVSCPRTQHNVPGQGSNPDRTSRFTVEGTNPEASSPPPCEAWFSHAADMAGTFADALYSSKTIRSRVENCANSICISHQCKYLSYPSQMRREPCRTDRRTCKFQPAFSTRLKLVWPRSSLKTTKMSKKRIFCKKLKESMGLHDSNTFVASLSQAMSRGKKFTSAQNVLRMKTCH